jgi:2-keto-4-pentenoate hydratase
MSVAPQVAALLLEAHASGRQIAPSRGPALVRLEDVYAAQDLVVRALGGGRRVQAWKVIPPHAGAEPRAAPVCPGRTFDSPATLPAAGMHMLGIEVEIGYRFARDLPPAATDSEVAAAVLEALVTIELCDTRLQDWEGAPALWRLADLQSNAALVLGSGTRAWREIAFGAQRAELWVDSALRAAATGSHPCADPFGGVLWLARHCAARGAGLRAGDVVTTGSWTGMDFVAAGAEVLARFPGIGEATLRLAA